MSVEEIEKRRAERREAIAKARAAQYEKDLEQVDKLEAEHGDDRVEVLETSSFVSGLPTLVVVKTPEEDYYKRYRDKVRRARKASGTADTVAIGAAQDELGLVCVVYPDRETYERMRKEWPSIHDNVGIAANKLGEAKGKE